ncbi:CaiB/BaiF CoA transferase family protein [Nitrospirillum iridis]|uniref:Crotonobetainyl-CoA:carnitine CoA-transferase CaiB-like acyl-CoA transferase n=1 Tax=Nitrospirillum iridis TaxID=765888 RepID=A0A7X0B2Q5_9PROT|nr:CoA transferase [Nitrospirillum iridis]MBB6253326.1 crotonobetainyl-CoA:carnitine CoA-transferase CaiB-like acyl-CoA transferase [Nitrospirillum iridis]
MTALRTIRIIELAEGVAGEYCGKLLADFGASVIKIERPGTGSPTRHMGPFKDDVPGTDTSGLFAYLNTNKKSVTLDLAIEAGVTALRTLLDHADVVIDDHDPEWLAAMGLDPRHLADARPGLILCAITPFGFTARDSRHRNATDLTVMHASGWAYHTPSGETDRPPLKGAGRFLASYEAGLEAAMCVAAALHDGLGRFIDVSAQEVMASRVDYVLGQMVAGDMDVDARRTRFDLGGPAGIFPCRQGHAYVWMSAPSHWQAIRQLLGDPDWVRAFPDDWLERGLTPERIAECRTRLGDWLRSQDKDEVSARAQQRGLTMVPVNDPDDLLRSPQFTHRGFFRELDHPALGHAVYPTVPYKLSATPAHLAAAAPLLGQHTAETIG